MNLWPGRPRLSPEELGPEYVYGIRKPESIIVSHPICMCIEYSEVVGYLLFINEYAHFKLNSGPSQGTPGLTGSLSTNRRYCHRLSDTARCDANVRATGISTSV